MLHDGIDDDDVLEGDEMINIMKLAESGVETKNLQDAKELLQADDAFSDRVDEVIFGFVFSPPHRFTVSPMVTRHGKEAKVQTIAQLFGERGRAIGVLGAPRVLRDAEWGVRG